MGPFQLSATPFQGNVIFEFFDVVCEPDLGPQRLQKVFFLMSTEWPAEKGIRIIISVSQVLVNTFVALAACTSLPCMFSLTLHLNLRHFDCLSSDSFISPLLFFGEASL